MVPRKNRKTFVQLVREVGSISQVRDLAKRRIAVKRRRALAPRDPAAAIAQLKAAGARYSALASSLLEKIVLPNVGNDFALANSIEVFARELDLRARMVLPSARSAAKKAARLANQEYARAMGVELPATGVATGAEDFAAMVVKDYEAIASAQAVALRGLKTAEELRHMLWVVQNRTATVARTRTEQFFSAVYRMWTERGGDEWSVWVTRRDRHVRDKHKAWEGRVFRTVEGIDGVLPGQEVNCRCKSVPASVDLEAPAR